MKKEILAAAAVSGSLLMISGAWAQTCVTPPSCEELGYTFSAEDCEGVRSLICPFDSSKYFCSEAGDPAANATPGMILYSDGTVSNEVISDKTAVGVVAYVAGSTRFAVALEETMASFATGYEDVPCLTNYTNSISAATDLGGVKNTLCMINYNGGYNYLAAEYCNNYKAVLRGTGSSGWYLPAAGELSVMNFSYGAINLGLQKLSKTQLDNNYDYYWSSSEAGGSNSAWRGRPIDGDVSPYNNKNYSGRVRCVLAF